MFLEIWHNILLHRKYLNQEELREFQKEHNIRTFTIGSILVILISFLFAVQSYLTLDTKTNNPFGKISYLYIYLSSGVMSIFFLSFVSTAHQKAKKCSLLQALLILYPMYILSTAALLSALSLFDIHDMTAYLLALISISILYSGSPISYIFFNFWSMANIAAFIHFFGNQCHENFLTNMISFSIVSIFFSAIAQYSRIQNQILTIELKASNQKLSELSIRDPLTHLYNRRFFIEFLENRILLSRRTKEPLLVMILDIDFFKQVNDTLGHTIGDHVILDIASILKSSVRESDVVARYGGEEFVVVLPNAHMEAGLKIGKRILTTCQNHKFETVPWSVTLSAGIAKLTEEDDAASLLSRSDIYLYKSKQNGRNQIHSD